MPSQYPSESQLSSRQGGKMVSGAHSPHVRGRADREDVVTHRTGKEASGKETGKEQKSRQNGGLPHLVIVRAHRPKPVHANASSPSVSLSAPHLPRPAPVVRERQTHAQPTPVTSTVSEKTEGQGGQRLCPQEALSYTTAILSRRADRVLVQQRSLDQRLQLLHRRVRGRQARGMCRHVQSQIKSAREQERREEGGERTAVVPDPIPMQVDGAVEDVDVDRVTLGVQFRSCDDSNQSKRDCLDSNSADHSMDEDSNQSHEPKLVVATPPASLASEKLNWSKESSSPSNEFKNQSDRRSEVVERWRQQLRVVCAGVGVAGVEGGGGEVTDGSSDDEGGETTCAADIGHRRLQGVCRKWERSRGPIGSQWAWLRHRITQINQQLSQLDSTLQRKPKREPFLLSPPSLPSRSLSPLLHPPSVWGVGVERGKVVNGASHAPSVPHLLIPDGILNGPIQVKDLLSPSPLTSNMSFVLDDASGYTCARTWPLHRKPARKIVHLCQKRGSGLRRTPRPVLPRDTPSWVWLDEGVQQVLRDHPYASIPQPKRCYRAATRTRMLTLSPSPGAYDMDTEISVKSVGQRRPPNDICPWSPNLSRSSTPVPLPFAPSTPSLPYPLTPSLSRKKKPPSHTPSYDIDNIVIPYSVAAATRLEKLEYKEIMTPRWRELGATPIDHTPSSGLTHCDMEDVSNEAFLARHEKFELSEKKRFMNFIIGGQRKRIRPSSLSSTLESLQNSPWPPAKVRRATLPSSPTEAPSQQVPVLSWPPRSFPLQGGDIDALTNPPPPPPLPLPTPRTSSSTPSPLLSRPLTPSLPPTPSTSSVMVTPLGTPLSSPSTPFGENPISPSEWAVNSHTVPKTSSIATPGAGLVLRLTKRI